MKINKRVKLGSNYYYIQVDVGYVKDKTSIPSLCLCNFFDDYWDGGDCSLLIEKIENDYTSNKAREYDAKIYFMGDVLYIYDRMPFISGVYDIYPSEREKLPSSFAFISKDEIEQYIKDFNIQMKYKDKVKTLNGFYDCQE